MLFSIKLTNKQSAFIGCMHRSPSANIETSTMAVCNIISLALNIEHTHFLLVGDFYYNDIDWESEYVYQIPTLKDDQGNLAKTDQEKASM